MKSYVKKSYLTVREKIELFLAYVIAVGLSSFSEIVQQFSIENIILLQNLEVLRKYDLFLILVSIALIIVENVKFTSKNRNKILARVLSGATVKSIKVSYILDSLIISALSIMTVVGYEGILIASPAKQILMAVVIGVTVGITSRKLDVK